MTDYDNLARTTNAASNPHHREYHITVAQFRDLLADQPDDAIVVLSKDAEGNGFSPLSAPLGSAWYVPESTWSGEVFPIGPDADGDIYEPDGQELFAVVLDPIN
jgi:hypothetical protein